MPDGIALILALTCLAVTLGAAIRRPPGAIQGAVACGAAAVLVAAGAIGPSGARDALSDLGPTIGFLAALLLLGDGCRRGGLFAALGRAIAGNAREGNRLLILVFAVASGVTAVLSLDATVVLLTPVVFEAARRLRAEPAPHLYACGHLSNSASLLLPVSNLTNLLAFHATGLSFTRFAALMALPWSAVIAVEFAVLRRHFRRTLAERLEADDASAPVPVSWFAVAVVAAVLIGFASSGIVGIEPVWFAAAGAAAISLSELRRPAALLGRAEPSLLLFVAGIGVVVAAASGNGLESAVDWLLPTGESLPALVAVAAVAAVVANVANNLPATLMILPVATVGGPGPVLAALIGLNVGPNLTYTGSLATLLWRRQLAAERIAIDLPEFTKLGLLAVPAGLIAGTVALWISLQGWG